MVPSTCLFLFMLWLNVATCTRIHPLIHPTPDQQRKGVVSPDVVAKACETSSDKALCVSILKSQNISGVNDFKQATFVAIKMASVEAVSTSELIKEARKKEENKDVVEDGIEEETLEDCDMSYISLVEILDDATSALMTGPEADVLVEIKAAITTAETCQKSIAGGRKSPMVEEVAKKNENVTKFCSNALSVYNVYATGH